MTKPGVTYPQTAFQMSFGKTRDDHLIWPVLRSSAITESAWFAADTQALGGLHRREMSRSTQMRPTVPVDIASDRVYTCCFDALGRMTRLRR